MPPVRDTVAAGLRLRAVPAISEIDAAAWNACANPRGATAVQPGYQGDATNCEFTPEYPYNPFISYEFLSSLEDSGSATARAGWQPQHLAAEAPDGTTAGVVPCYLKSHSQGEYVFDRGWAEAYERAGGQYYPKLQVSVPFTPVTGRRLLAARKAQTNTVHRALAAGLVELCRIRDASSAHVTFALESEWRLLGQAGFLQRTDQQYHWFNAGYRSFDDFLAALAARKRKIIKRERR